MTHGFDLKIKDNLREDYEKSLLLEKKVYDSLQVEESINTALLSRKHQSKVDQIAKILLDGQYIYKPGKYQFATTVRINRWIQKARYKFLELLLVS